MTNKFEEQADDIFKAVAGYVERAISMRTKSLLDAETRLVTLIEAAKGDKKRLDELESSTSSAAIRSLEQRLSRHADHLAALEGRLKKLEHK